MVFGALEIHINIGEYFIKAGRSKLCTERYRVDCPAFYWVKILINV